VTQSTKKMRRPRGTLGVIVALLLGSVAIRIITGADAVLAENNTKLEALNVQTESVEGPEDKDLEPMFLALKRREELVEKREMKIDQRMVALNIVDARITKKISDMRRIEKELRATIALANTAAEDDLARLTTVYESMKPKVASALFSEMDADFAAGFLARMRPDSAALVLAGMPPQKAYEISAILAGRNANVPKN
jgi:flagellar motility protein MotE (MotC chaperone)